MPGNWSISEKNVSGHLISLEPPPPRVQMGGGVCVKLIRYCLDTVEPLKYPKIPLKIGYF
jgi:hypothetical protein